MTQCRWYHRHANIMYVLAHITHSLFATLASFVPGYISLNGPRFLLRSLSRWLMSRYHADRTRKYFSKRNTILFALLSSLLAYIYHSQGYYRMISIIFINPRGFTRKDKLRACKYRPWVYRTACSAQTYCYSRLFSLELIGASERGAGARSRKYSSEIDQSCKSPEAFAYSTSSQSDRLFLAEFRLLSCAEVIYRRIVRASLGARRLFLVVPFRNSDTLSCRCTQGSNGSGQETRR